MPRSLPVIRQSVTIGRRAPARSPAEARAGNAATDGVRDLGGSEVEMRERVVRNMDELHVGSIVHHLLYMPIEEGDDPDANVFVCEAAIVTKIADREQGIVSLYILPEASVHEEALQVPHGTTDETWHSISECWTGA
jgi:hypothetical protein